MTEKLVELQLAFRQIELAGLGVRAQRCGADPVLVKVEARFHPEADFDRISVYGKQVREEYFLGRWEFGLAGAAQAAEVEFCPLRCRLGHGHRLDPLLRHVTEATVGAAAAVDCQFDCRWPLALDGVGQADEEIAAVDDLLAEEFVGVGLALREFRLAEHDGGVSGLEAESALVHVETVVDGPVDFKGIAGIEDDVTKDFLRWRRPVGRGRGCGDQGRGKQQSSGQRANSHKVHCFKRDAPRNRPGRLAVCFRNPAGARRRIPGATLDVIEVGPVFRPGCPVCSLKFRRPCLLLALPTAEC
jgi:hypothetical protein